MKSEAPATIDAYIAAFPEDVQAILQRIRAVIRELAPEATEAIKYQIPTFVLNKTNLVHFAAFKQHIGFYPTPTGTEQFQQALVGYKVAKGSIRLPLDQLIPYDLIRDIVAFRVAEVKATAEAKKRKK